MSINRKIADAPLKNRVEFVTTVPCKQLAGVIELIDQDKRFLHVPSNKEDEGMGLCAGAYMGGKRACIIMQNTAIGVTSTACDAHSVLQYPAADADLLPWRSRGESGLPGRDGRPHQGAARAVVDSDLPLS